MKHFFIKLLLSIALISVVPILAHAQSLSSFEDLDGGKLVPNFHRVTHSLYRGAQPRPGFSGVFKTYAIDTIICLSTDKDEVLAERAEALRAGFTFYWYPLPGFNLPSMRTIRFIQGIIEDCERHENVVYIHCLAGADRTGVEIGVYLIDRGYPTWFVMAYSKHCKMHWWEVKMKHFLKNYKPRSIETHV